MKNLPKYWFTFAVAVVLISAIVSCFPTSYTPVYRNNVALLYNPGAAIILPEYSVTAKSETEYMLISRVQISDLLFNMANERKVNMAKMRLKYVLYTSLAERMVVDSASNTYAVYPNKYSTQIVNYTTIKTPEKRNYVLAVELTDLLRNRTHYSLHFINNTETGIGLQNSVMYKPSYEPVFNRSVKPDSLFMVLQNGYPLKNTYIQLFNDTVFLPPPPFSTSMKQLRPNKADSVFFVANTDTVKLKLRKKGLMFFSTQADTAIGTPVYSFSYSFPNITTADALISPLIYLCTTKEYEDIKKASNPKLLLDAFWLKTAGSSQRAKELIRIYYNRVKFANIYFSSFTEGWQTDRGMVYIIFGPPGTVLKNDTFERWIYGENYGGQPIEFVFERLKSSFTDNDFELRRSADFASPWRKAVESWRKGKVYSYETEN